MRGRTAYIFAKVEMEPALLPLGVIFGSMIEECLRLALLVSRSDPMVFVVRPISSLRRKREGVFVEYRRLLNKANGWSFLM